MHVRRLMAEKKAAPSVTTLLLGQKKRAGLAALHASLVLSAITVGLIVITAAFVSQGTNSLPANPNAHSSSLGSSAVSSSNSLAVPSAVPSAVQYPLVFAPNSPQVCEAAEFCINATLEFSNQAVTNNIPPVTTITNGSATTIVRSSTTTIISGHATTVKFPDVYSPYSVYVRAFVRDAATGRNVTTSSGQSDITGLCYIQLTGFTHCYVAGEVPRGHTYKVTVFVTKPDGETMLAQPSPPLTFVE
jgi:hypothetical protein